LYNEELQGLFHQILFRWSNKGGCDKRNM